MKMDFLMDFLMIYAIEVINNKYFQMWRKLFQLVNIFQICEIYANRMSRFSEKFIISKKTYMEKFHKSYKNIYPCIEHILI